MDELSTLHQVCILGLLLGVGFGITAQKTHFCTMGAISDIFFFDDWNRFRAWLLAIAIAMIGTQMLHIMGFVDLSNSIYTSPNFGWAGAIIGGLLFGFGMTLGGGCGNKTLVRLGSGNLKSLIVAMIIGVFAYMTLRGLIGVARVELESLTIIDLSQRGIQSQSIPDLISFFGADVLGVRIGIASLIAISILYFCFKCQKFRQSKLDVIAGSIIGLLVPIAWYTTGVIGMDDFDPIQLQSFSFIAPVGDGLQYLMTFTGATISFGVAVIGGIVIGAFISSILTGEFKLESFSDASDMVRHIVGGGFMGIGGVLALGCTIGQGVSGVSTLAVGSVLALLSIIAGGIFGMKYLEEGTVNGAIFSILGAK